MPRIHIRRTSAALLIAAGVAAMMATAAGQRPVDSPEIIQSLSESGQGLEVRARSAGGLVSFAATSGRGLLLPSMAAMPAEARALAFVDLYGEPFGLRG